MVDPVPKIDHRELLKMLAFMFIGRHGLQTSTLAHRRNIKSRGSQPCGSSLDLLRKIPPALIIETIELKIGSQPSSAFRHAERLSEQHIR
jgi:hypothetical protein